MSPRVVDEIPGGRRNQRSRHDWDAYLDGQVWEFLPEQDFQNAKTFPKKVYDAGYRRGIRVHVAQRGDKFYIQALGPAGVASPSVRAPRLAVAR